MCVNQQRDLSSSGGSKPHIWCRGHIVVEKDKAKRTVLLLVLSVLLIMSVYGCGDDMSLVSSMVGDEDSQDLLYPEDSVSNVGSRSSSTAGARANAAARKANLIARSQYLEEEAQLQLRLRRLQLNAEVAACDAEESVFDACMRAGRAEVAACDTERTLNTRMRTSRAHSEVAACDAMRTLDTCRRAGRAQPTYADESAQAKQPETASSQSDQLDSILSSVCPSVRRSSGWGEDFATDRLENPNKFNFSMPSEPEQRHCDNKVLHTHTHQPGSSSFTQDMANALDQFVSIPKPEILYFEGDPLQYWKFINSFETGIANRVNDDRLRLSYLIQYCKGEARDSIDDCVILEPAHGYRLAREILDSRYGRKHIIAQSYINKLVDGEAIKAADSVALSKFALHVRKCHMTLEKIGYLNDLNNRDTISKVVRRLPAFLKNKWVDHADRILQSGREPCFADLSKYIEERARIATSFYGQEVSKSVKPTSVAATGSSPAKVSGAKYSQSDHGPRMTTLSTGGKPELNSYPGNMSCLACGAHHDLGTCPKFQSMSFTSRRNLLRENWCCDNCFLPNHISKGCLSRSACTVPGCTKKHHYLLHWWKPVHYPGYGDTQAHDQALNQGSGNSLGPTVRYPGAEAGGPLAGTEQQPFHVTGAGNSHATGAGGGVCMRVLPVKVKAANGDILVETYALLDDCSDVSLCSEHLAASVKASGPPASFHLSTVNQANVVNGFEVRLEVFSLDMQNSVEIDNVWTVNSIPTESSTIPDPTLVKQWPHLQDIEFPALAKKEIHLLIGSNIPEVFWSHEQRIGNKGDPYGCRSLLGWTVIGPLGESTTDHRDFKVNLTHGKTELADQIERLWTTDFNDCKTLEENEEYSQEDKFALKIMEDTVHKDESGHYECSMLWRTYPHRPVLACNRPMVKNRLHSLKKRFERDPELHQKYAAAMDDNLQKGYASEVTEAELATVEQKYYISHHPVFHPEKKKLRVVYDLAAKYRKTSLNDQLLKGPEMTNNLVGVVHRFRQHPVALMADITAMFNQTMCAVEDRQYLRFLWWPDGDINCEPKEYKMNVHLFGARSSPCCASFCLKQTAEDNKQDFDADIISSVNKDFYVDDYLKSTTPETATRIIDQLPQLLERGQFHIRGWISNWPHLLQNVPEEDRASSIVSLDLEGSSTERCLGITWDVRADSLQFSMRKPEKPPTRRGILSIVSSLYDPLGIVAPVVLPAKRILQESCRSQLGWDEKLPIEDQHKWTTWCDSIDSLRDVVMPRCLLGTNQYVDGVQLQLHSFSDASSIGYGAVTYLRVLFPDGTIHCSFVMGKSRLAPLNMVTIPRLELMAAVVAVRLDAIIVSELDLKIDNSYFWTDSTVVLGYIENQNRRFKTFVANRLTQIHSRSKPSQWNYVDTKSNPADYASRGLRADQRWELNLWLQGPLFLWQHESHWPERPNSIRLQEEDAELKKEKGHVNVVSVSTTESSAMVELIHRYSHLFRLLKAISWLRRFVTFIAYKVKKVVEVPQGPLSVSEIDTSRKQLFCLVQHAAFSEDLEKKVSARSRLKKLSPFVDEEGLLRVGGRLERSSVPYDQKHPVILPSHHHVTDLVIRSKHTEEGHTGQEQVLAALRSSVWIVHGRSAVRRVLSRCIECKKRNAITGLQFMAPLPVDRLTPDKPPFTYVGVDFFGNFNVKQGRSVVVRYGCLFTCLTTRAVHLEVAHSLDTDSFLNAVIRFISRRGKPELIRSDNGTNFRSGQREMQEAMVDDLDQDRIQGFLLQRDITWAFNIPAASHMGGVWERMVKSVKQILVALVKQQLLNDESLVTFMAEVERILNSRPICPVSDDPKDLEALSPSQLLLLKDNGCEPMCVTVKEDCYSRRRWRQVQYLADIFWKRWTKEYLPQLQVRQKWFSEKRNLQQGDLVMIADSNVSRGKWLLGRIEKVNPDNHGLVRSAKVRTATGFLDRPITKLCFLEECPIQTTHSDEPAAVESDRGANARDMVSAEVNPDHIAADDGMVSVTNEVSSVVKANSKDHDHAELATSSQIQVRGETKGTSNVKVSHDVSSCRPKRVSKQPDRLDL